MKIFFIIESKNYSIFKTRKGDPNSSRWELLQFMHKSHFLCSELPKTPCVYLTRPSLFSPFTTGIGGRWQNVRKRFPKFLNLFSFFHLISLPLSSPNFGIDSFFKFLSPREGLRERLPQWKLCEGVIHPYLGGELPTPGKIEIIIIIIEVH